MTGRWYLPAGDIGKPTYAVHQQASGPLTEIRLGPAGEPWLEFRSLEGLDDLIGVLVAARAEHGQAQARHAARPLVALPERDAEPAWAAPDISGDLLAIPANRIGERDSDTQPDPYIDAIAAEHGSEDETGLPHRAPLEAPIGEPTCDERDGNYVCTASPLHPGDHAAFGADGSIARQWEREPASEDATT